MFRRNLLAPFLAAGLFFVFSGTPLLALTALNPQNTDIGVTSMSFTWSASTPPYVAAISTAASFSFATTWTLSATATTYINLVPDAIHYFRVKRQAEGDAAYLINIVTTGTYAAAPANPSFLSDYFVSDSSYNAQISLDWQTNGNPDWTDYEILFSTDSIFSSSKTYNEPFPPVILGGLAANTTYFLKVRAVSLYGTPTVYTTPISSATMALKLGGIGNVVYETSATVSWLPVSGPAQAQNSRGYRLILSTSVVFDGLTSDWSTSTNTTSSRLLTGLLRNTTYYYKVGALNWNGAANFDYGSFTTLSAKPQNPLLLNFQGLSVSDQSIPLGWTALPLNPSTASALGYRLEAASAGFTGSDTIFSSSTYDLTRSTLTVTGLDPNTTWYLRAASLNNNYAANYTSTLSTITLSLPFSANTTAAVPAPQSITVVFTPLPASPKAFTCEGYRLEASSAPFGSGAVVYSSATDMKQLNSLTVSGLRPNTSYYLRLGTLNWSRNPNYTDLNVAKTSLPVAIESASLDSVWETSATVSFASSGVDGYVVDASTYQYFNWVFASSATLDPGASNLILTGLPANTVFNYRLGSLFNGATVYINTTPSRKSTLAPPVSNQQTSGVFYSSITAGWTPQALWPPDFAGEKYLLEASTSADFYGALFSSRAIASQTAALTVAGLAPNTKYYLRAGTLNWDQSPNFVYTPSTTTLANTPVQQPFNIAPLTMTVNWFANSNPSGTVYWVVLSSNSYFSAPFVSSTTVLTSATFYGLIPNTTYYPAITAFNQPSIPTGPIYFSPTATGAYDPAFANYSNLDISSITVNWLPGSNPGGTAYLAQISSEPAFSGAELSSVTTALTASFAGLVSNASYYLRVSALNLAGVPTYPPLALGTALTLPATPYLLAPAETFSNFLTDGFSVSWENNGNSSSTLYSVEAATAPGFLVISTSVLVNAKTCILPNLLLDTTYWVQLRAVGRTGLVSPFVTAGSTKTLLYLQSNAVASQDNTITLNASYGPISIFLPGGSLGNSTKMKLQPKTSFAPPVSDAATLKATNIGLEITYFPPTLLFKPVTITVAYLASGLSADADRSKLILALYDETSGVWAPLPSLSDTAGNRVIAQSWHLSTFQIMEVVSNAGLSSVKIYPNPYRPSSVSDVIHFTNMPPYSKIKIYTFLGELVRALKADINGMAVWNGDNAAGQKAASGVYIALIQTPDKKTDRLFKVALER